MRGSLELKSFPGKGTSFTIKLPLNLGIVEGLMVRLEESLFLIPLSSVEECIELTKEDQKRNFEKNVIMVRGQLVPYIQLRETFEISGEAPDIQQIVITFVDKQRIGFVVDQVIGEYQTVIKSWGKFCNDIPGISGATILGDGTVALIADPGILIRGQNSQAKAEQEGEDYGF
jgi:two-component system chemotaxis sensor kinase CheA